MRKNIIINLKNVSENYYYEIKILWLLESWEIKKKVKLIKLYGHIKEIFKIKRMSAHYRYMLKISLLQLSGNM